MLIFYIILFINLSLFSQPQIESEDISKYYSVSSLYMNVLKLDEGELIFYGGDGGVLRTYDNGNTWQQNYSGSKVYIPKLRYHENVIYGVTQDGRFMKSSDKGEYWEYQKLSNGFNDLVVHDNTLYLSTFSDTVFVSGDFGISWNAVKTGLDSILNISSFNNYLIINNKFGRIYYTEDISFGFVELSKPLHSFFVNNKYDGYYIYSNSQIAELKEDLTWELYDLGMVNRRFKFIPEDDYFTIFSAKRSTRAELGLETFQVEKKTKEVTYIGKFRNELLNSNDQIYNQEYEPFDVELSGGKYFSSNYYKTILTTENLKNWNININSNITSNNRRYVFDENNIVTLKSGMCEFVRSTDGGKTFKIEQKITYDTIDGNELVPKIDDYYFIDKDNALINLNSIGYFHNGSGASISKDFIEIKDGEYSELDITFDNTVDAGYLNDIRIMSYIDDSYIIETDNDINKTVPDEFGKYGDSINYYRYYKYKDNQLQEIYKLTRQILLLWNISTKDRIFFSGNLETGDTTKRNKTILYSMTGVFEDVDIVKEFDFSFSQSGIQKYEDMYVIVKSNDILEFDDDFNLLRTIETEYEYVNIFSEYKGLRNTYFTSGRPYNDTINGIIFTFYKGFRFYLDEEFNIIEDESEEDFHIFSSSINNKEFKYSIESRGYYKVLIVPIEEKYLNYYLSVTERAIPPSFWTYPPYPNPVNDRLSMRFYTGEIENISNLKVELIEIGSGYVYEIKDYNITMVDNYFGVIEFDLSDYQSGAYLVNFKLGNSNKSESIIIE